MSLNVVSSLAGADQCNLTLFLRPHISDYLKQENPKKYCHLLKLNSEADVDEMFKRNIALIEFRARQLKPRGYGAFALGTSLNFALFIEVVRSDRDIIECVKSQIFKISQDNFDEDINEVRTELGLPAY